MCWFCDYRFTSYCNGAVKISPKLENSIFNRLFFFKKSSCVNLLHLKKRSKTKKVLSFLVTCSVGMLLMLRALSNLLWNLSCKPHVGPFISSFHLSQPNTEMRSIFASGCRAWLHAIRNERNRARRTLASAS